MTNCIWKAFAQFHASEAIASTRGRKQLLATTLVTAVAVQTAAKAFQQLARPGGHLRTTRLFIFCFPDTNLTYPEDLGTLSVHSAGNCKVTNVLQGRLSGIDCQSSAGTHGMTAQCLKNAAAGHDLLCVASRQAQTTGVKVSPSPNIVRESGVGESGPASIGQ